MQRGEMALVASGVLAYGIIALVSLRYSHLVQPACKQTVLGAPARMSTHVKGELPDSSFISNFPAKIGVNKLRKIFTNFKSSRKGHRTKENHC